MSSLRQCAALGLASAFLDPRSIGYLKQTAKGIDRAFQQIDERILRAVGHSFGLLGDLRGKRVELTGRTHVDSQVQQWRQVAQSQPPQSRAHHAMLQASDLSREQPHVALFGGDCGASFSAGLHIGRVDQDGIRWRFAKPRKLDDMEPIYDPARNLSGLLGRPVSADAAALTSSTGGSRPHYQRSTECWPCPRSGHAFVRMVFAEVFTPEYPPRPGRCRSDGTASGQGTPALASRSGAPDAPASGDGSGAKPGAFRSAECGPTSPALGASSVRRSSSITSQDPDSLAEGTASDGDGPRLAMLLGGEARIPSTSPVWDAWRAGAAIVKRSVGYSTATGALPSSDLEEPTDAGMDLVDIADSACQLNLEDDHDAELARSTRSRLVESGWSGRVQMQTICRHVARSLLASFGLVGEGTDRVQASAWVHLVVAMGLRSTPRAIGWIMGRALAWIARDDDEVKHAREFMDVFGEGDTAGTRIGQETAAVLMYVLQSGLPAAPGAVTQEPRTTSDSCDFRGVPDRAPMGILSWMADRLERCMHGLLGASRGTVWPLGQAWVLDLAAAQNRVMSGTTGFPGNTDSAGAGDRTSPFLWQSLPMLGSTALFERLASLRSNDAAAQGTDRASNSTPANRAPLPLTVTRHTAAASPSLSAAIAKQIARRYSDSGADRAEVRSRWRWASVLVSFGGWTLARGLSRETSRESLLEVGIASAVAIVVLARESTGNYRRALGSSRVPPPPEGEVETASYHRYDTLCCCIPLSMTIPRAVCLASKSKGGSNPLTHDPVPQPGARMDHRMTPVGASARLSPIMARDRGPAVDRFVVFGGWSQVEGFEWGVNATQCFTRTTDSSTGAGQVQIAPTGIWSAGGTSAAAGASTVLEPLEDLQEWKRPVLRSEVWELAVRGMGQREAHGLADLAGGLRSGHGEAADDPGLKAPLSGTETDSQAAKASQDLKNDVLVSDRQFPTVFNVCLQAEWRLVMADGKTDDRLLGNPNAVQWDMTDADQLKQSEGMITWPKMLVQSQRATPCARSMPLMWSQGEQLLVYGGSMGYSIGDQFRIDSVSQKPQCRLMPNPDSGVTACDEAAASISTGSHGGAEAGPSRLPVAKAGSSATRVTGHKPLSCLESCWQPSWKTLRAWAAKGHKRMGAKEAASVVVLRRTAPGAGPSRASGGECTSGVKGTCSGGVMRRASSGGSISAGGDLGQRAGISVDEVSCGVLVWGGASRQFGSSFAVPQSDAFLLEVLPRLVEDHKPGPVPQGPQAIRGRQASASAESP